jgi:uncharacterized protein (DUF58 family)
VAASDVAALARVIDAVRGVRWSARRPVAPAAPGAHGSRRRGTAVEFTEYRPYRQGDDPRGLDWKLLARTDRAYVRLTDDHAVLPTTIVVDASLSMAYPLTTRAKWWMAARLALGFAAVAQASGDPVGVTVVAGDAIVGDVARTTRRGVVATIASMLAGILPGDGSRRDAPREIGGAGGRWVVVSDFLQADGAAVARARSATVLGGEVYAVHVVAHEELDPPRRALLVSDPEDPAVRRPLLGASRSAYLDAFGAWREQVREAWQSAGARYAMASTDEAADRVVRRVVRL